MNKTKEQVIAELDAMIPRDAVSQRAGGGGKSFSYLQGHYVIDRMNKVLGQGNWSYEAEEIRLVHTGEVTTNSGTQHTAHYIARVRLEVPTLGHCIFTDVGYGDGSDKVNPGKAHELAAKEAVTDAFKRCAKNLGMSMGLALYDKEQTNVDDSERPSAEDKKPAAQGPARAKPATKAAPVEGKVSSSAVSETPPQDRDLLNQMISEMATTMTKKHGSKGQAKLQEVIKHMRDTYQVQKKEQLSDAQAQEFYQYLRGQI